MGNIEVKVKVKSTTEIICSNDQDVPIVGINIEDGKFQSLRIWESGPVFETKNQDYLKYLKESIDKAYEIMNGPKFKEMR
jgi:hypothetical protein